MVFGHSEEPNYVSSCYALTNTDEPCTDYITTTTSFNSSSEPNKVEKNEHTNSGDSRNNYCQLNGENRHEAHLSSSSQRMAGGGGLYHQRDQFSFMMADDTWSQIAEATLPLKTSEHISSAAYRRGLGFNYNSFNSNNYNHPAHHGAISPASNLFNASTESRSREISKKLIYVNVISLIINLVLAFVAFYFSFVNNSSSTSAFAADCVLDFISSAIVLWRYYGDLNSVYMHAREQIACIYLGALFEISAIGIIIKASSDIVSEAGSEEGPAGYDIIYLAVAATIACTILTVFKCSLYKTIRDKSILLDVINTVISTIFAMSIIMSQLLISVDLSFWYLDPILSIVLALFMAGFGLKVIHQNFNILRPSHGNMGTSTLAPWAFGTNKNTIGYTTPLINADTREDNNNNNNFDSNLNTSVDYNRSQAAANNWQKSDYSSISFV